MARMIPSYLNLEQEKSSAEIKIFKLLSTAKGTENWIVLHSLNMDAHESLYHGELDFIVLVPEYGIFDLEVKGGRVSCHDGIWSYTDRNNKTTESPRGPFDQGWEGIYSVRKIIRNRLDEKHKYLKCVLVGMGAVFPDIDFDAEAVNEEKWRIFDQSNHDDIYGFVMNLAEKSKEKYKENTRCWNENNFPDKDDCVYIAHLLRPDFDCVVSLNSRLNETERKIVSLTDEEYETLDTFSDNKRVVIYGPAGTGKTLLALEEVKRQTIQKRKVGIICFNNNLANWMTIYCRITTNIQPEFVGTIHGFMLDILQKNGIKTVETLNSTEVDTYYQQVLPVLTTGILNVTGPVFDELIIDEAQDILKPEYLDVMNACLKGGLQNGSWKMFGDFIFQNIYNGQTLDECLELLKQRSSFAIAKLTKNCRNTDRICETIRIIVNDRILNNYHGRITGEKVSHRTFRNLSDEKEQLNRLINELLEQKINAEDIVILSPYRYENSVVSMLDSKLVCGLSDVIPAHIRFSTIHAFKGLESEIVIITDINRYDDISLSYVGLSRARAKLILFENVKASNEFAEKFVTAGGKNEG